jgi:hypothetical protein
MADPLDNVNEVLAELQGAALHTSQGSFVRVEHVERLLKKRQEAAEEEKAKKLDEGPPPRTWDQARRRAARDLKAEMPSSGPREPGKSTPAQPPSRA